MKAKQQGNRIKQDLSLLAIEAAEELANLKKGQVTDFKSLSVLNGILTNSATKDSLQEGSKLRLDHALVISSAGSVVNRTIPEIANEAHQIELTSKQQRPNEDALDKLISFFVALSDCAALYNKELEELRKHFA